MPISVAVGHDSNDRFTTASKRVKSYGSEGKNQMVIQENYLKHNYRLEANNAPRWQIQISNDVEDANWDRFLQETPGGHHVQSSLWAQLKASLGWDVIRLLVTEGEQLVAGAQILTKSIPILGKVGYIPKGPICKMFDDHLERSLIDEIQLTAKRHGIRYLSIQPPPNHPCVIDELVGRDFQQTSICVAPTATMLIELSLTEDEILSRMKSQTRRNILRSQRSGLHVREADGNDLPYFYRLLCATGKRSGFSNFPAAYFEEMYRIFHPRRAIKLLAAEAEGEIVSMILLITFNDTASCKFAAWSGRHGGYRPNEGIHWAGIQWAKSQGFKYYDFEGIDECVAKLILNGQKIPEPMKSSANRFKLGFKGKIQLSPCAYDHIYNPVLSFAYRLTYPIIRYSSSFLRLISLVRISTKKRFQTQSDLQNSLLNG
jgi:lipid II:glycine glycyltransferase (peptidoglycan interpeptide bridge formation enzyme)